MRRIAITVDVEAHKPRALDKHVERLIWGRQHGREHGIGKMMDIADNCGVPLTFFLDYPEAEAYGEDLLDVGREIFRRGHDLEPHCHPEYLYTSLFGTDDPDAVRIGNATPAQASNMVEYLADCHIRVTGSRPLAHRSRGYELSTPYLDALQQAGIILDASYSLSCKRAPLRLGLRGPFRFVNDLLEIPVPFIPYFQNAGPLIPWNFNHRCFLTPDPEENLKRHKKFLESWFTRHGDGAVATLIMHSWSFWKMDLHGMFTLPADETVHLFQSLLAMLKEDFEIVSLAQIAQENQQNFGSYEVVSANVQENVCPVCYEPASHFKDFNGGLKRLCPFCGSVERQRSLVDLVYAGAFGPQLFHNKDILHIGPGWAEGLLLRRMHGCRVTSLDALPDRGALVADIQSMPQIADNSFDLVLVSGVFRNVRHLDAALQEIVRVLRPGGVLLNTEPLLDREFGYKVSDQASQSAWYGAEILQKYGVGKFREFGRRDWEQSFAPYFHTRVFITEDKATGLPVRWLAGTPKKGAAPVTAGVKKEPAELFTISILRSNAGRIFHDAQHDPLSKFLPEFKSWRQFRQSVSFVDLTWLKEAIFALHFKQVAPIPSDGPKKGDFPPAYPADLHPYNSQAFYYLLPELEKDPAHSDSLQLRHIASELERWIDRYGFYTQSISMDRHTYWMVWHDTAVAVRLNFMAYTLLRVFPLPQYDSRLLEKLFRSALDHFLLLCADHFFTDRYNHGLLQLLGLLSFAASFPSLRGSETIPELVMLRLEKLLGVMITADNVVREHSPEYHVHILPILERMKIFLTRAGQEAGVLENLLDKMRTVCACFILPDGTLAPFGDTSPYLAQVIADEVARARKQCAALPPLSILHNSGYAFLRIRKDNASCENTSCLTVTAAFHSLIHKHCDELSFIWSEGKQHLLVDSGMQYGLEGMIESGPLWDKGFYYSVPNRVYAESTHAHNVVEINGETWSRRVQPWGVLPLSGRQLSEKHWLLEGLWNRPEGFRQRRRLIFSPGRWLLVLDELEPLLPDQCGQTTKFSQWFHFDASLDLLSHSENSLCLKLPDSRQLHCHNFASGQITMHKGEFLPRLQGWQAIKSIRWLDPAIAVGIHQTTKTISTSFMTIFSLIGSCVCSSDKNGSIHLRFANNIHESILL
ncbi:heparinase II/III family protein [Desulfovibrio sp. ZJ200]|uniref:heparinase II/III domain-containing protein n=1 Tax=Desulfovibrio sp. ZJ200 TaxID=2709792 RepID=UPI0013EB2E2B|nr:heparinase II/III family protein [Desulfovibrio sp. ZJ200]